MGKENWAIARLPALPPCLGFPLQMGQTGAVAKLISILSGNVAKSAIN